MPFECYRNIKERLSFCYAKGMMIRILVPAPSLLSIFMRYLMPEAYIFINPKTGSYYRESFLKRIWQSVRTKAGISNTIRLYDATRHSFGSQLVNSNVPIYTVSKLLGHSSIKTTERYCHSHIENLRINMNKISLKPISTVTKLSPEKRRQRKRVQPPPPNRRRPHVRPLTS